MSNIKKTALDRRDTGEKEIEQRLVRAVKAAGGICPEFTSPGFDGMPDRLVLLPGGKVGFVEVKAPGRKLRLLQARRKRQPEALGFQVFVLDGLEQIIIVMRYHIRQTRADCRGPPLGRKPRSKQRIFFKKMKEDTKRH